jgi:hypothetical protein
MRLIYRFFLFFIILFATACSNEKPTITKPLDKRNHENTIITREFYTNDGKTKFIIDNKAQLNDHRLDQIDHEIQTFYYEITHHYKNPHYDWEKTIKIVLRSENDISFAKKNEIVLYNTLGDHYLLPHELTHTLLGFGDFKQNEFNAQYGYLTQEGLAVYLQEKFSPEKIVFPTNGLEIHSIMKYIIAEKQNIPLKELASNSTCYKYFNSPNQGNADQLLWKSYIHSGSFVKYLIERYGKNKFLQVYNTPDFISKVNQIYNKSLEELEKEWISYIRQNVKDLDIQQRGKLLFP